jgi:Tol biopolymer transport system component
VFYQWPVWSPEGTRLYVQRADSTGLRIERIDVSGGGRQTVVERGGDFDVSPDGQWLAFARNADAGATLNLVRLDGSGGGEQVLASTRPFQTISAPRFTADGRMLLFSLARPQEVESARPIGERMAAALGPRLALAHGLPQDIYSMPVEGGPMKLVVLLGADDPVAAWAPGGDRVAVLTLSSVGIVPPGGSLVPILAPGSYGSVDWAP